jgi:hypothetical protein
LQCSHCGALAALHRIWFCLPKFTFISGRVLIKFDASVMALFGYIRAKRGAEPAPTL